MEDSGWASRKSRLLKELRFSFGAPSDEPALVACRITVASTAGCEAMLLDLQLGNSFEEAPRLRSPKVLQTRIAFRHPEVAELRTGDDYMLVGAVISHVRGPMPHQLTWPKTTATTGYVKLARHSPLIAEVAEFFAGGLNAWTCAASLLPMRVTMRVDCKKFACQMMTVNDREKEATGLNETPPIHESDVADMRVLCHFCNEEAILASPPCQPYSSLGRGQGLDAISARSWDSLFRALRIVQRRYAIIENVCGLLKHPDFQEIVKAFQYCGYILVAKRVCDATPIACAARPRVVLIFWNNADWHDARHPQAQVPSIGSLCSPVPCSQSGSMWPTIPEPLLQDLLLSQAEHDLLSQRTFLPHWLRSSQRQVWELRSVQMDRPFPSVTAAYHRSLQLPRHHAASKGLHVPVVSTPKGFRRLCKWEILHSMGLPMGTIIPEDEESAISLIGESFPPSHAFEAIIVAFTLHPDRSFDQCQVDSFSQAGLDCLRPKAMKWEDMTQVNFQGWAKLAVADLALQEAQNLSWVVQSMWRAYHEGRLSFRDQPILITPQPPPNESSFFHVEPGPESIQFRSLAPECPPRWLSMHPDDDPESYHVLLEVAHMWGFEASVTVCVHARFARDPCTLLVDELSHHKIGKRLVLCQGLIDQAVWMPARVHDRQYFQELHLHAWELAVNGSSVQEWPLARQDGDVLGRCSSLTGSGLDLASHDSTGPLSAEARGHGAPEIQRGVKRLCPVESMPQSVPHAISEDAMCEGKGVPNSVRKVPPSVLSIEAWPRSLPVESPLTQGQLHHCEAQGMDLKVGIASSHWPVRTKCGDVLQVGLACLCAPASQETQHEHICHPGDQCPVLRTPGSAPQLPPGHQLNHADRSHQVGESRGGQTCHVLPPGGPPHTDLGLGSGNQATQPVCSGSFSSIHVGKRMAVRAATALDPQCPTMHGILSATLSMRDVSTVGNISLRPPFSVPPTTFSLDASFACSQSSHFSAASDLGLGSSFVEQVCTGQDAAVSVRRMALQKIAHEADLGLGSAPACLSSACRVDNRTAPGNSLSSAGQIFRDEYNVSPHRLTKGVIMDCSENHAVGGDAQVVGLGLGQKTPEGSAKCLGFGQTDVELGAGKVAAQQESKDFPSHGPLNPRLPWPRHEPQYATLGTPSSQTGQEDIPETQKFRVHLAPNASATGSVAFTASQAGLDIQQPISTRPCSTQQSSRRQWPSGALKGGHNAYLPSLKVDFDEVSGWWLCILGEEWLSIDCHAVAGRTIRQERESLRLMNVDSTQNAVFVISKSGIMQATWHYKFPHRAQDDVVILITPIGRQHLSCVPSPGVSVSSVTRKVCCGEVKTIMSEQDYAQGLPCDTTHDPPSFEGPGYAHHSRIESMESSAESSVDTKHGGLHPHTARRQSRSQEQCQLADVCSTTFFEFVGGWRCIPCRPGISIAQVLEEEWGVPSQQCIAKVDGKLVSLSMCLDAVPKGVPVRIAVRIRGGAAAHAKKLRELLGSKGVSQDDIPERVSEIMSVIGDHGLVEAFSSFDPWQALKAKCHGKIRIIKQAESRHKARKGDDESDPLQTHDPWAEALQARSFRPDASFFQTSAATPPAILQSVARGASGIVMVDEKEASLLAMSQDDMSPDELAAITLGEPDLKGAARPWRVIEFPCYDQHNARLLVKGTLIDLGTARVKVVGEDTIHDMQVASSSCVAIEVHREEYDEWDDFTMAPIRHLKRVLALNSEDVIHSWGRKAYRNGKLQPNMDQADSVFLMVRLRSKVVDAALKLALPGLYPSPRLESGQPDHNYKIVWCSDKTLPELRVLAQATEGCLGVVRSRSGHGIRVKCADFSAVKSKITPGWVPQQNTPYDEALPLRFDLHHVHPGACREDLQRLLNEVPWKAIVIRQSKPRQWLVAAHSPPPRDTILTVHGCILALPSSATGNKGKGKGKPARARSRGPDWLLGFHGSSQTLQPAKDLSTTSAGHIFGCGAIR